MKKLEAYLLDTGKFKLFFSFYFRFRYAVDLDRLYLLYHIHYLLTHGTGSMHPHDTFITCTNVHNWSFDYYNQLTRILLYLDEIEPSCIINLRLKTSISESAFTEDKRFHKSIHN